jgi:hypothetical protein
MPVPISERWATMVTVPSSAMLKNTLGAKSAGAPFELPDIRGTIPGTRAAITSPPADSRPCKNPRRLGSLQF